jgi:nicotinate-nucleotide adenylyltransferase
MRRTIGIYGGSFNPIHNGHIALARQFITAMALDEVWFVVSPQNPFKVGEKLLDDDTRLAMVQQALVGEPQMRAADVEFHLPRPSYMWNTLEKLSEDNPDCEFVLLIGGDNWSSFSRWYKCDELLEHYRIAVYPREGDVIDEASLPANVSLLHAELLNISSTAIRKRLAKGMPVDDLIPPAALQMIMAEKLYQEQKR